MASKVLKSAERPPNAGKGRVKGVPNKVTKAVKEMVLAALDKVGGEDYLVEQARKNPTAFLTLVGKVLPLDVTAKIEGQQGYHFLIETVGPNAEADQPPIN